ncbi:Hypothetical protein BJL86_0631 [Dietzia timorensis]|uniref:Mce/MlaD domain-containing protein n=2 Tax=Dietzia timorensis TaxID=499555 RepID=A0A173LHR6_9ACTN|nr:Hypothetical protein BJL86_0631 [Dietzia timorensis]
MRHMIRVLADSFSDVVRDPRRNKRGNPIVLGAISIVLMGVLFVVSIGVPELYYQLRTAEYHAAFDNAAGLKEGDRVLVAGVPSGRVADLSIESGHAVVTFRLDEHQELGAGTSAHIGISSLLGNRFLEVTPAGTANLGDERLIEISRTSSPYSLDDIDTQVEDLADNLDTDSLATLINDLDRVLPQDTEGAGSNLGDISAALRMLRQEGDNFDQLVTATRQATGVLAAQEQGVTTLKDRTLVILQVLADRRDRLIALIENTEALATQLNSLLDEERPEIDALTTNLTSITETYKRNKETLDSTLTRLAPAVRGVTNATGNGPWTEVAAPSGPIPDALLCTIGVMTGCR